jgi:RNA polymerase sigma factor (sigma-70 family)
MINDVVIHIVDDDPSVRKALSRLLASVGLPCMTYALSRELLDAPVGLNFGCIVLDLQMPGLNGLELQRELRARGIDTPIIFLTGHGDIPTSVRAMKGGAVDFLTKPFQEKDLLLAIEVATERDRQLKAKKREQAATEELLQSLTPRERQVLDLVIQGSMNKEIADALGTSEKTIKVHRGRVMHKMRVNSVAALVHLMERVQPAAGLAEPDKPKVQ